MSIGISQVDIYQKKEDRKRFFGAVRTAKFLCVISIEDGYSADEGKELISQLEEESEQISFVSLARFESWIQDVVIQANAPASFSLAATALYGDTLYLKTVNMGKIYLKREKQFTELIEGDISASGSAEKSDFFIFTTTSFRQNFHDDNELHKLITGRRPEDIPPALQSYESDLDENDCIAMFVEFGEVKKDEKKKEHHVSHHGDDPELIDHYTPDRSDTEDNTELGISAEKNPEKKDAGTSNTEEPLIPPVVPPVPVVGAVVPPVGVPATTSSVDGLMSPDLSEAKDSDSSRNVHTGLKQDRDIEKSPEDDRDLEKERVLSRRDRLRMKRKGNGLSEQQDDLENVRVNEDEDIKQESTKEGIGSKISALISNMRAKLPQEREGWRSLLRSRKFLIVAGVIIVLLLGQSVFFSHQKMQQKQVMAKVVESRDLIEQKLTQSEEIAYLNPERSVILLNEARAELNALRKTLTEKEQRQLAREISDIEKLITRYEGDVLQKEEASYSEFFDLALEDKNATGIHMSLADDVVSIVDPVNRTIYVLSLTDKSIEKRSARGIVDGTVSSVFKDKVFMYVPDKGVYRFTDSENVDQVIKPNDSWGSIIDMDMYYGNIYLLDKEKSDVYRFMVVQNGYGGGGSYFTDNAARNFSEARSMAIDGSIYIALKDQVLKFTRGQKDDFNTTFPYEDINLEGIYTDENTSKVYVWDKNIGSICVLGKNGRYEREIYAEFLKKAQDFIVWENDLYILSGTKIYKIDDTKSD